MVQRGHSPAPGAALSCASALPARACAAIMMPARIFQRMPFLPICRAESGVERETVCAGDGGVKQRRAALWIPFPALRAAGDDTVLLHAPDEGVRGEGDAERDEEVAGK